jgi:hypothetical protein
MDGLIQRIRERLEFAKACTIFESDLERIWPREKIDRARRERAIQIFAKQNGWAALIRDPGIRVTLRGQKNGVKS